MSRLKNFPGKDRSAVRPVRRVGIFWRKRKNPDPKIVQNSGGNLKKGIENSKDLRYNVAVIIFAKGRGPENRATVIF